MYILGLNAFHADSSAAIFKDGVMIAATEEERFTRVKHWAGFPVQAINFCLREAGISLEQVDHITIVRDPGAKLLRKLGYLAAHPSLLLAAFRGLGNSREVSRLDHLFRDVDPGVSEALVRSRIRNIEHHRSHLASAFFASPFEEAALLSIDGSGKLTSTRHGIARGKKYDVL